MVITFGVGLTGNQYLGASNNYAYGQNFLVVAGSTYCSTVTFGFKKSSTTSPSITCSLYSADVNGKPTGSALATNIQTPTLTSGYQDVTFTMGVNLTAASKYIFVVTCSDVYLGSSSGNTYSDGFYLHQATSGGAWTSDTPNDLYGNTLMVSPQSPTNASFFFLMV